MKRVITCLSLLLLTIDVKAQNITQYEYWTDDDYSNRLSVSSSDGNVALNIETETLTAGVHFLNFRAERNDGVWGNFYRYLYYIPTLKSSSDGNVSLEYWLDDNLAGAKRETTDFGHLLLTIDVSTLAAGVHYFNCTPISVTGERGTPERYLFYVPLPSDLASLSAVKGFEYWLDDNLAGKIVKEDVATNIVLAMSIDGLTSGVHYFNCRAFNERGDYGSIVRKMFYIPKMQVNPNAEIAKAEYWLDDDYNSRANVETSSPEQAFTIDINHLGPGVHYFNYRAIDGDGETGSWIRQMFFLAHSPEISSSEMIDYEYWIDEDTANKVVGSGALSEYIFNIDISNLTLGNHKFSFRAKNLLEQWGETFIEEFEISNTTVVDMIKPEPDEVHDVFSLTGFKIKSRASVVDLKSLPSGIYIYGGKKVLVP